MKLEEKKSIIADIESKKKDLMIARIKISSGDDSVAVKDIRKNRKDIARLFTKLNSKKVKI